MNQLIQTIESFASQANNNIQVKRITKDWQVDIHLECTDVPENYCLKIENGVISKITSHDKNHEEHKNEIESILLRSDSECFNRIFSGHQNPALASLHGELEVYGKESHSVKLDAISLILWGF